jgi:hypothetical protein
MGIPSSAASRADVSLEERTSIELVKLVNKLRWVGLDEEAEQVQEILREIDPAATLLAGPWETD